jgi:hypothetical protein
MQTNLTHYQPHALKKLPQREDIHFCDSDKNLGPAAGNGTNYKSQVFAEHLNTVAYGENGQKNVQQRMQAPKRGINLP